MKTQKSEYEKIRIFNAQSIEKCATPKRYRGVTSSFFGIGILPHQICWIFGISVGIDPPLFCILSPFPPPFFPKGGRASQKGSHCPPFEEKGGRCPLFLYRNVPTKFSFGIGMVNTEKYRPNTDRKYRIDIQL